MKNDKILILRVCIRQDSLEKQNNAICMFTRLGFIKLAHMNRHWVVPQWLPAGQKTEKPVAVQSENERDTAPVQGQRSKIPLEKYQCKATFKGWWTWSLSATGNVGRKTPSEKHSSELASLFCLVSPPGLPASWLVLPTSRGSSPPSQWPAGPPSVETPF